MHDTYKYDDQSVRKNEWIIRLVANGTRVCFAVFREDGPAVWSPATHGHVNSSRRNRLSRYRAWQLLRDVDRTLGVKDEQFWLETMPGLAGVNTELWPRDGQQRHDAISRIAAETRQVNADLLYCDCGTGLATAKIAANRRRRSQMHLYWNELGELFDNTACSLAVYQHGRRASWTVIADDYRAALAHRECQIPQLSAGRARLILVLKPQHAEVIRRKCLAISAEFSRPRVYEETGTLVGAANA